MGVDPVSLVLLGGYDSRIIHDWFHGGKGPESTTDANYEGWLALSERHEKPYQLIQDAVWESGASWEGQAAEAAAVQALTEYMAASTETMSKLPQFTEPGETPENTKQPNAESSTVNNSSTVSPQSRGGGSYGGSYTSPVTPTHRSAVSSASVTPIPNTPPSSSTPWAAGGVCWRRCRARGCRSRACSCAGSSMSVVGV